MTGIIRLTNKLTGFFCLVLLFILILFSASVSAAAEKYYISVGSFVYTENAEKFIKQLEDLGMKTFTEKVIIDGTEFTRVTLDIQYSCRFEAERAVRVLSETDIIKKSGARRLWLRKGYPPYYDEDKIKETAHSFWHENDTAPEVYPEAGIWTAESIIEGHRTLSSIFIEDHPEGFYRFIYPAKELEGRAKVFGSDKFLAYSDKRSPAGTESFSEKSIDMMKQTESSTVFIGRVINKGHIIIDEIWQDGKKIEFPEGSSIEFKKR